MAAGKINLQANDTRIYEITAEDGAGSNVAITLPKEGGMLVVDAEVVHKTGYETIAGVKTFSDNVGIGTNSPVGTLDVTQKSSDISSQALVLRGYTTGANGTRNCNIKAINSDNTSWADITFKAYRFNFSNQGIGTGFKIDEVGNVLVTGSGGLGYGIGSGGTVTQLTSKSTSVTLNKPCGQITMNSASLAAGVSVEFFLNNNLITNKDTLIVNSSGNGSYRMEIAATLNGQALIRVTNITAFSLSESPVINFLKFNNAIS